MSKANKSKYITIYLIAVSIFILTLININSYLSPKKTKVLGIEVKNTDGIFWYEFLEKNPNYIPGWIEIGRTDKAHTIDPNYF